MFKKNVRLLLVGMIIVSLVPLALLTAGIPLYPSGSVGYTSLSFVLAGPLLALLNLLAVFSSQERLVKALYRALILILFPGVVCGAYWLDRDFVDLPGKLFYLAYPVTITAVALLETIAMVKEQSQRKLIDAPSDH